VALVWYEVCENRSDAQQREYFVRRLSRPDKQRLAAQATVVKDDEK